VSKSLLQGARDLCLALPDTRERDHYGETGFCVKGKLFAALGETEGACEFMVSPEAERAAALVKRDARSRPYARDPRVVVLDAAKVRDREEVRALTLQSYELRRPQHA
jgi:hypothetical protein